MFLVHSAGMPWTKLCKSSNLTLWMLEIAWQAVLFSNHFVSLERTKVYKGQICGVQIWTWSIIDLHASRASSFRSYSSLWSKHASTCVVFLASRHWRGLSGQNQLLEMHHAEFRLRRFTLQGRIADPTKGKGKSSFKSAFLWDMWSFPGGYFWKR